MSTRLIGERTLAILRLLLDHDVFTPGDVHTRLKLGPVDDEETFQRQLLTERVTGLVAQLENVLGDAWAYETNHDDEPWTVLEERVDAVLREYEALEAEVEEP